MERIIICAFSLIIISILTIIYFSKPRLQNVENLVYRKIVLSCLSVSFFEFIVYFAVRSQNYPLTLLFERLYQISMSLWTCLVILYSILIFSQKNYSRKLINTIFVLYFSVFVILELVTPLTIFDGNGDYNRAYVAGPSVNIFLIHCVLANILLAIILIRNFKHNKLIKIMPGILIISMNVVLFLAYRHDPSLILTNQFFVIVTLVMFFTIENPDLKLMEELKYEKERADRANNAKSDFLARMSHEIRTPINGILGSDTIILRHSNDAEITKYAENIQVAGNALLALINEILDFSKIESGRMELTPHEYEFGSLIGDVYTIIDLKAETKNLYINLNIDKNIPHRLYGDDIRLRQILINLLTNAVKYTPQGDVNLNVELKSEDKDTVTLYWSVEDTGIGIKEEDLPKLTERFVRIEESRNRNIEGTGLGLNVVTSLLDLMNSKLEVSSTYGIGSTFSFALRQKVVDSEPIGDISKAMRKSIENMSEHAPDFALPDARFLVVDDNALNRTVFRGLLEPIKCHIDEARSGPECLDMVAETPYDIIFLDLMMPNMDGFETLQRMKSLGDFPNKNTPVVMLTADVVNGIREKCLEAGCTEYLAKPINIVSLEKAIARLIPDDKKQLINATIEKKTEPAAEAKKLDTSAFPKIDGVNWDVAIAIYENVDMLKFVVQDFAEQAPGELEALLKIYDEGLDTDEKVSAYRIKVHSMKSCAASIGAVHVSGLAKYLEYAAKENDLETINSLMPLFTKEWNKLIEAMKEV